VDGVGDLLGQSLLDLESPTEHLGDSSQLAEAQHPLVRNVSNGDLQVRGRHEGEGEDKREKEGKSAQQVARSCCRQSCSDVSMVTPISPPPPPLNPCRQDPI